MCFNSPYAEAFLTRALELAAMGVDGFYFDEVHMPKTGCWCTFCRKGFKTKTGLNHPRYADHDDPIWHKLIDFNNVTDYQLAAPPGFQLPIHFCLTTLDQQLGLSARIRNAAEFQELIQSQGLMFGIG